MRRVLIALLIVAGISAVLLAIGISRDKSRTPPILENFLRHTFEGEIFGAPGEYVSLDMYESVGPDRYKKLCKRWQYQAGTYIGIIKQTRLPTSDANMREFELLLAFDNADVPAEARLVRYDGRWMVDRIWLDLPTELEATPEYDVIEFHTRDMVELLFLDQVARMWVFIGEDEQERLGGITSFLDLPAQFVEQAGTLLGHEQVGEVTGDSPDKGVIRRRAELERGHVDFELHWTWHDVFWSVERFEYELHVNP